MHYRFDKYILFTLVLCSISVPWLATSGIHPASKTPQIDAPSSILLYIALCENPPKDSLVRVTNNGTSDLIITTAYIKNGPDFSIYFPSSFPLTVSPGASTYLGIRFDPLSSGYKYGDLIIVSNAASGDFTIKLNGRKESAELNALSLYYGVQKVINFPVDGVIPLHNRGTVAMQVDTAFFGASPPFTIRGTFPIDIPPNGYAEIPMRFNNPGFDGYFSDTLTVVHTPRCDVVKVLVAGSRVSTSGIAGPVLVEFARHTCNYQPKDTAIVIENPGFFDLIIDRVTLIGDTSYSVLSRLPKVISSGDTDTLTLRFTPQTQGAKAATLTLHSNAGNDTAFAILLTGTFDSASLAMSSFLDFGIVRPTQFPASRDIVVRNTGTLPITITGYSSATGAPFTITTPLPKTIESGDSLLVTIRFLLPIYDDVYIDTLRFQFSPSCTPLSLPLRGRKVSLPKIEAPNFLSFSTLRCLMLENDTSFYIKNSGGDTLIVSSFRYNGVGDFSIMNPPALPLRLAPGDSTQLRLRFAPKNSGLQTVMFLIDCNSLTDTVWTIVLEGVKDSLQLSARMLDFGTWQPMDFPLQRSLNISNTGSLDVVLDATNFGVPGFFKVLSPVPINVRSGQSIQLIIQFDLPPKDGKWSDTLDAFYFPSCSPLHVEIHGGLKTLPSLAMPLQFHFLPLLCEDGPIDSVLIIRNTGTIPINFLGIVLTGSPEILLTSQVSATPIAAGDSLLIPLRYAPAGPGTVSANLSVSFDNDSLFSVDVAIEGEKNVWSVATMELDFGRRFPPDFPVVKTLWIKNFGTLPVTINSSSFGNGTNFTVLGGIPAIAQPRDSVAVQILFNEPSADGIYSDTLLFDTTPSCSLIPAPISGEYATATAHIEVATARASPGEEVSIPIFLRNARNVNLSGATQFHATLRYNASLLSPLDLPFGTVSGDERTIPLTLPTANGQDGSLLTLRFRATLGKDTATALYLENPIADGGPVDITLSDGYFSLIGICREGGARLFDGYAPLQLPQNHPNPFNPATTIEFELIEHGFTSLKVYDANGRFVKTLVFDVLQPGKYRATFDARDAASGIFFAVLTTPTWVKTIYMVFSK